MSPRAWRVSLEADTAKIFELEERKVKALEQILDVQRGILGELMNIKHFLGDER
jgi:hypothetical protein